MLPCLAQTMAGGDKPQEIVDTHIHLWTPTTHHWVEKVTSSSERLFGGKYDLVSTYLPEDYRKDTEGYSITHSVHIEAGWGGDHVGETVWLDKIADSDARGVPHATVGYCDLSSPQARDILQRHCESKRMRGIRQLLLYHPTKPTPVKAPHDKYLTDPQWLKGVALLEEFNLSFEFLVLPEQMHRAAEVTRQFPSVKFMLNHCGLWPLMNDEASMKLWREGLAELALQPNVFCKASGMFSADPAWTQKSVADMVQPVLDTFGMDRCVFASNFPVDRVNGTFPQLMDCLQSILQPYSPADKQKFFCDNAKRFYNI